MEKQTTASCGKVAGGPDRRALDCLCVDLGAPSVDVFVWNRRACSEPTSSRAMELLLDRLSAESAALNPPVGQAKHQELEDAHSLQASLDSSASVLTMPGPRQQAAAFERTASVSSVSTISTRINGTVPFAPQCFNVQRGSAGAKVGRSLLVLAFS